MMGPDMIIAVSQPLSSLMSGITDDLFWLDMFNQCLKVRAVGPHKNVVHGCVLHASVFLG